MIASPKIPRTNAFSKAENCRRRHAGLVAPAREVLCSAQLWFRLGFFWLGVTAPAFAACQSFPGSDAPRPALGPEDVLEVDPGCVIDLTIGALAAAPRLVSMSARRADTGLGAEGVPVTVFSGACNDTVDAGDAGSSQTCGFPGPQQLDLDAVRLEADRACTEVTARKLECSLDPSGTALFQVLAAEEPPPEVRGYVPVCIRADRIEANASGTGYVRSHLERQLYAVPRRGTTPLAASVVFPQGSSQPAPDADCRGKCGDLAAIPLYVGLVSNDKATEEIRTSDFLVLQQERRLKVSLEVVDLASGAPSSAPQAFLSDSSQCMGADAGGTAATSTSVEKGSAYAPLWLCAPGYGATYRITASDDDVAAAQTGGQAGDVAAGASIDSRSRSLTLDARIASLGLDEPKLGLERAILVTRCGLQPRHVTEQEGLLLVGDSVQAKDDQLVVTRPATCSDAGLADAASACPDPVLSFNPAGTCTLTGAWQ